MSLSSTFLAGMDATFGKLKINNITEKCRNGRPFFVKRRGGIGRILSTLANLYFDAADIPIRYWSSLGKWQRWEVQCFRMLNSDMFDVRQKGSDTVYISKIPGHSLWWHLTEGAITTPVIRMAAKELRRAHSFLSEELGGLWSHGDASMSNFIYDDKAGRVRMIDFEIVHQRSLPATVRHADDLMVFLLDLAGFVSHRQWLPLAMAFLDAYEQPAVVAELCRRLVVPRGLASLWWNVRTNFIGSQKIGRRLEELRQALTPESQAGRPASSERSVQSHRATLWAGATSQAIARRHRWRRQRPDQFVRSPGMAIGVKS